MEESTKKLLKTKYYFGGIQCKSSTKHQLQYRCVANFTLIRRNDKFSSRILFFNIREQQIQRIVFGCGKLIRRA